MDEDKELLANLANDASDDGSSVGDDGDLMAALAGNDEDVEELLDQDELDKGDDDAQALVVRCLDNLLNF